MLLPEESQLEEEGEGYRREMPCVAEHSLTEHQNELTHNVQSYWSIVQKVQPRQSPDTATSVFLEWHSLITAQGDSE